MKTKLYLSEKHLYNPFFEYSINKLVGFSIRFSEDHPVRRSVYISIGFSVRDSVRLSVLNLTTNSLRKQK